MPNFSNSIIYKITGNNLCYIGSTTEPIQKRLCRHLLYVKDGRYCSSSKVISDPNHIIELVEAFPCENSSELKDREFYWYSNIKNCNDNSPKAQPCKKYDKYIKNNIIQYNKSLERSKLWKRKQKENKNDKE